MLPTGGYLLIFYFFCALFFNQIALGSLKKSWVDVEISYKKIASLLQLKILWLFAGLNPKEVQSYFSIMQGYYWRSFKHIQAKLNGNLTVGIKMKFCCVAAWILVSANLPRRMLNLILMVIRVWCGIDPKHNLPYTNRGEMRFQIISSLLNSSPTFTLNLLITFL